MSSTIEFDRRAYRIEDGGSEDYFLALVKLGGSNVFRVNPDGSEIIAKDWRFFEFGQEHEIIRKAGKWAEDTEGGMLRYGNGYTKPENYLKNWRKTLQRAGTFKDFKTEFSKREGIIEFFKDSTIRPEEGKLRKLNSSWGKEIEKVRKSPYPKEKLEKIIYTLPIESIKELREFTTQKARFRGFLDLKLKSS